MLRVSNLADGGGAAFESLDSDGRPNCQSSRTSHPLVQQQASDLGMDLFAWQLRFSCEKAGRKRSRINAHRLQMLLGGFMPLIGGFQIPGDRFDAILCHSETVLVHPADVHLGFR